MKSGPVIVGNAIFAETPLQGGQSCDNVLADYAQAREYQAKPTAPPPGLDLYPKLGKMAHHSLDLTPFTGFVHLNRDFNGQKREGRFHGAYTGAGRNPGLETLACA
ncbi:MAG: hypothetical protein N3A60_11835 [Thermanaerothrix sp.]|nr:hypothetical protein [Thermanaerothrix sp.]